jgi:hypothetical protein
MGSLRSNIKDSRVLCIERGAGCAMCGPILCWPTKKNFVYAAQTAILRPQLRTQQQQQHQLDRNNNPHIMAGA